MAGTLDLDVHPLMHTDKIVISTGRPGTGGGQRTLFTLARDPDARPQFLLYVHDQDEPAATVRYDAKEFFWTLRRAGSEGMQGWDKDLITMATDWVTTRFGLPDEVAGDPPAPAPAAALEQEDYSGEPLQSERWDPADGEYYETDPQERAEQAEEDRLSSRYGE